MTDFLGHLVDAPLANILIIAGLLFLGIGAVGKITGKIEPNTVGRVMAGLLGIALLAVGAITHIKSDSSKGNTPNNQTAALVQPVIHAFSVTPTKVIKGDTVTISWDVLNADDVEIEPFGEVPATGDRMVQLEQTTIYRLSATNKGGAKSGTFQEAIVKERGGNARTNSQENEPPDDVNEQTVSASEPPPDLPDYTQPSAPDDNCLWTPGSWYYNSAKSDYYWVPGEWVVPPLADWLWTPPYWEYDGTRYQWNAGYWSTSVGFYGGIDYGFGYTGSGYERSKRNTTSANRVSYNGGPRGVQKTRAPLELAAERDRRPALSVQMKWARDARGNREQYSRVNNGRPRTVAVAKLPSPHQLTDHPGGAEKAEADKTKADAEKAKADRAEADAGKAKADRAKADAGKAKADKAKADAEKAKADRAEADAGKAKADRAKADAGKAKADKAKADAEKAKADKAKADAGKAKADKAKADAEKAKADKAKADAEKAKAQKARADAANRRSGNGRNVPPKKP